jgi:hypothetical protein
MADADRANLAGAIQKFCTLKCHGPPMCCSLRRYRIFARLTLSAANTWVIGGVVVSAGKP